MACLAGLGAAHAADDPGPREVRRSDSTPIVQVTPGAATAPMPYPRSGTRLGRPGTPATAAERENTQPAGSLPSLDAVPVFRGAISQLGPGRAFAEFIAGHGAAVVLLDLLAPADGNGQAFFPGPELGGDTVPNFTLYGTCDRLPFGQTPGSDPALGCTGTTYRLAGMAGRGASFDYAQGYYRLHGYFRVHAAVAGAARPGLSVVTLQAIDPRTLPA
ncbi:conserved hypothetical protein [Frankia canadensis]|uniref:Uncharacterized protein n=1 Tax=Frankia canadensis TaxID=1836972 RepID=A0A2I2KS74_9ACTN|nr:conserved hypothetical protein [Frankia canadensis]SOU55807.1 conserved hypothetical protein [Frankia canadensis]